MTDKLPIAVHTYTYADIAFSRWDIATKVDKLIC